MKVILRVLVPDKKDVSRRIAKEVAEVGGKIDHWHPVIGTGGLSQVEIVISFAHQIFLDAILRAVERIPGVATVDWTAHA
jgi:hypothetical protein